MSTVTAESRATKTLRQKSDFARKLFEWGGFGAGAVLVAFGVVAIVMGFSGRATVTDSLKQEKIVGSADMTPALIAKEAKDAGLTSVANMPTVSVAGKAINSGPRARAFASYMRIHALEATGGQTYAEMGRFLDKNGKPTSDENAAAKDPKTGQPVENGLRNLWVTETALTTALNVSYFAENVGVFGLVMGIALLLTGVGFLVLTLGGLERKRSPATAASPATAKT